jgi:hypothetical protein
MHAACTDETGQGSEGDRIQPGPEDRWIGKGEGSPAY